MNNFRYPDITYLLKELVDSKLLIDPLITGMQKDLFGKEAQEILQDATEGLLKRFCLDPAMREKLQMNFFGQLPISDRLVQACIDDFLTGTSIYLSQDIYGKVKVDLDVAQMSTNDVTAFINHHGLANLCWCYITIVGFENHQAIQYYQRMNVRDFKTGAMHRPWASYSLEDDLKHGSVIGIYQIVTIGDEQFVELTEFGQERLKQEQQMLEESGYIHHRMKAMFLSQFDQLQIDYEKISLELMPTWPEERQKFLDFVGVSEGMQVLELGCGTGALTFDAGLANRVGPTGTVTATDPSVGMLYQAEQKLNMASYNNVSLDPAVAESIPYADSSFDVVLGVAFFHFTDNQLAMKEMVRVSRAAGTVALFNPLLSDTFPDFYKDWFAEFFELTAKSGVDAPKNYLPTSEDLINLFRQSGVKNIEHSQLILPAIYDNPVSVVNYFVRGVGLFQRQLISLPWIERSNLIIRLIEKGNEIRGRYSIEERVMPFNGIFIKGTVTK